MAKVTSGSFNTTAYNNRYLTFSWTATQDIATNSSTISWTLKGAGGSSEWYKAGNFKVVIAGATVYSSTTRIELSNGTTVASGTKKITHNSSGAKSFTASVEAGIYTTAVNCKGSGSWDLKDIPRSATITSAPDFTDEENPTITYSNLAGNNVDALEVCIANSSGGTIYVPYRSVSKTGTSYTFSLTDAERTTLRKAITSGSTLTVRFYIRTTIGDNKYLNSLSKTMSLVNYTPTTSFVVKETNSTYMGLTGSESTIIKYHNNVSVTTGAAARKEATIKSQTTTCGDKKITTATGTMSNVTSGIFKLEVVDSRGNKTQALRTLSVVNYVPLTCSYTYTTTIASNNTATISLNIKGNYFNSSFGMKSNALKVEYRYKIDSGSYSSWLTATATKNGNKYTATPNITGLNYQNTYTVEVRASDSLETKTATAQTINVKPVFDWGKNDFAFNVPVSIQGTIFTGANKMLWGGNRTVGYFMNASQTVTLSEGISQQANGIVLVFCHYGGDDDTNRNYQYHYVPKQIAALTMGTTQIFPLSSVTFGTVGAKVLTITDDTTIVGSDRNVETATGTSGITYSNNKFVLRYVVGV